MEKLYKYPSSLIPHKGLKKEISIDDILKEANNFGLARRVEKDIEEYIVDMGDNMYILSLAYKQDHIKDPIDMSMNILTTSSSLKDAKFVQTRKPSCESWNGTNVDIDSCKNLLRFNSECHILVYNASNLHNKPGQYTRKYNDRNSYDIDRAILTIDEVFSKNNNYQRNFQIRLHHKPTNCNYWHITLEILAPVNGTKGITLKYKKWLDNSDLLEYIWDKYLSQGFYLDTNPCIPLNSSISFDKKTNSFIRIYNHFKTKLSMLKVYVPKQES